MAAAGSRPVIVLAIAVIRPVQGLEACGPMVPSGFIKHGWKIPGF